MARIFISYKRTDKEKVFKIKDLIESALGEKCWIDLDGIESDAVFKKVIINAINDCEVLLFMYSKRHSEIIDFEKDWTIKELNFASYKKKRIVFVNIDGSPLTDIFAFDYDIKQQIDGSSDEALARLCKDLRKWLKIAETVKAEEKGKADEPEMSAEEMFRLAEDYYNGENGKPKDEHESMKWLRKAAEQGYAKAQTFLALSYLSGKIIEKDETEGIKWCRKAAEQGDVDALVVLGNIYTNGKVVEKDYTEAVKWYRKAAEQGDAEAQENLGICYLEGLGVDKDYPEAVKWYRKAAEQGDPDIQFRLGYRFEFGEGILDKHEAVKWYKKAAEQGNIDAQKRLADCCFHEIGIDKDYTEAVKWYRKAAEQGNADAQERLGYCYLEGLGFDKDYTEAVKWFKKAAEQENADAQYYLAHCYENGFGVKRDHAEAEKCYIKADKNGNLFAKVRLIELKSVKANL